MYRVPFPSTVCDQRNGSDVCSRAAIFRGRRAGASMSSPPAATAAPSGFPFSKSSKVSSVQRTGDTAKVAAGMARRTRAMSGTAARDATSFLHVDGQLLEAGEHVVRLERLLGHATVPQPQIVAARLRPDHHLGDRRRQVRESLSLKQDAVVGAR